MDDLVFIERRALTNNSGSLYVLLPRGIKEGLDLKPGDFVSFYRAPGSNDVVIRADKLAKPENCDRNGSRPQGAGRGPVNME